MTTLNDLFKEYLRRIQPSKAAVDRAKAAHEPLRNDLEADKKYGSYVIKTILSGSYGRDTSIFGIKDVDVIVETSYTRQDLRDLARDGETEQFCLLRLTQDAICRTGRSARTRKNRRSIEVTLPEEVNDVGEELPELTMDIVPVLAEYGEDREPLTIADKDLEQWFDTYTFSQIKDSEKRNRQSSYIVDRRSYKPLVKIFKAWKKVHFDGQKTPKGFILECLTAQYHNPYATTWIDAVCNLFENILVAFNPDTITDIPKIRDISDIAPMPIPIAKTVDEAKEVLGTIQDHLALIKQAQNEAEDDLEKSARTLRFVFGDENDAVIFPLPDDIDEGDDSNRSKAPNPYAAPASKSRVEEARPFG